MKMNYNRDFEKNLSEGCCNTEYSKGNMPNMNMEYNYGFSMGECCYPREAMGETIPGVVCPPVYECPQETVCHRYICHEVPHIMPCNTRIINHHIYRHTYTPTYSCCEENEVQNVYERRCC